MRKKVTLVSAEPGAGQAPGLSLGLRKYVDLTTVWWRKGHHGLDYIDPQALYGFGNIPNEGDEIIIVSCRAFNIMRKAFRKRPQGINSLLSGYNEVKIVITDSRFMLAPESYNTLFRDYQVWATICKIHFRGDYPTKIYYRPFDLSNISKTKNDKLTVAHSPFVAIKYKEKGTEQIVQVMEKYKKWVNFDLITGLKWKDAIERKAKAHVFIDQISHYDMDKFKFLNDEYVWMALGKSGDEAMHLGCMTMTHGKTQNLGFFIPPVVWCTKENFENMLDYYLTHPIERSMLSELQYEWVQKYGTHDYAARNLLNML